MRVLSLFDGMACGYIAFKELGIPIGEYDAYEIDKYAIQTSAHNFPQIEHHGDVFKADFSQYEGIDWLIGGSPCTYWSIAQNKKTRETESSGLGWELFSQYVRALKEVKPKYFLYENNKSMAPAIRQSISETFGFEPICINSALVSAQSRPRLYWVGIRNSDGTYRKADIKQPEDKKIFLKDVLDGITDRDKGRSVIGSTGRTTTREYFYKFQGNMAYESVCLAKQDNTSIKAEQIGVYPRSNGEQSNAQAFRIYDVNFKSVTLKANGGGVGAKTGLYAIPVAFEGNEPTKAISSADGKIYPVYKVSEGKIKIKEKEYTIKLSDGYYIIRKLTVDECKRLQTVPEWYEFPVSDTQAYKMLGNGWTVDVIAHLIKSVLKEVENE